MLASAVAVPVVSFSLEAKICTIAVPVGSGLITVKLQISLLLVLVHGRPCSIVYICRSISNVDIVRSGCSHLRAGTYAGQFDSKLPSYALESSCIQIRFSVGLSAVLLLYLRLVVAPMISWCSSGVYHWGISASSVTSGVAASVSFCSFCRDKNVPIQRFVQNPSLISKLCVNSVWPDPHVEAAVEFTSVARVALSLAIHWPWPWPKVAALPHVQNSHFPSTLNRHSVTAVALSVTLLVRSTVL